jgi:hypothetical protein
VVGGSIALASVCLMLLALMPRGVNQAVFFTVVIVAGLLIFCIRGTYWSLLGDVRVRKINMGLAIGYISLFGYLADILAPQASNFAFGNFDDGNAAYFIITAIIGAVGVLICIVFKGMTKNQPPLIEKEEEELVNLNN